MDESQSTEYTGPKAGPGRVSEAAPPDVAFELLANGRRRRTLRCLVEFRNPIPLADVADVVAARERGVDVADVPADETRTVYLSLYHLHVPKMADAGVVDYSQDRDSVALSVESDRVRSWLAVGETSTPPLD